MSEFVHSFNFYLIAYCEMGGNGRRSAERRKPFAQFIFGALKLEMMCRKCCCCCCSARGAYYARKQFARSLFDRVPLGTNRISTPNMIWLRDVLTTRKQIHLFLFSSTISFPLNQSFFSRLFLLLLFETFTKNILFIS